MIKLLPSFKTKILKVLLTCALLATAGLWSTLHACIMPPKEPPTIHIERHSETHVWLTICGFTSFGSEGNNLCLCALGFDDLGIEITEIKSVEIVPDTAAIYEIWGQDIPLFEILGRWDENFKFGKDQRVSDAVEKIEAGDWSGFFSEVNGYIPPNVPVKIMFDICIGTGIDNEELLAAMKSIKILTDAGTPEGVPDGHHQHITKLESSSRIDFDDNRITTSIGEIFTENGAPKVHPMPLTAGETPTLSFILAADTRLTVELFNTLGRRVRSITSGRRSAGEHSIAIATADLAPGAYLLRIVTPQSDEDISIPLVR